MLIKFEVKLEDKIILKNLNIGNIDNDYGIFLIIVTIYYVIGALLFSLGFILESILKLFIKPTKIKNSNKEKGENKNEGKIRIERLIYFSKNKIFHDYYQRIKYQRAFIRVILALSSLFAVYFIIRNNPILHYTFFVIFIFNITIFYSRFKKECNLRV